MSDKYTAEKMEFAAAAIADFPIELDWGALKCTLDGNVISDMLRQAAKAQREREVGGAVTDADVEAARQAANTTGCGAWDGRLRKEAARAALESFAARRAAVPNSEVRLWDTQWMNIVSHDNCYRDWDKSDAINHAVKMTEQAIARNIADGKFPTAANNSAIKVPE